MKVTLLMAITVNGYIADLNDDTEWVKDLDALYKTINDIGVVVMGKRTYEECMKFNVFPYKGGLNVVMTHDKKLLAKSSGQALFLSKTPKEVIQLLQEKNFKHVLLIGGGHINGSFLKDDLVNEIILDIHPLIMAKGIHLFESEFPNQNLELVNFKKINDQILQVKYRVK